MLFRLSPALDVYSILKAKGATVKFHDPYVDQIKFDSQMVATVALDLSTLDQYDCVVITTNHSEYDIKAIVENSKLVVDTRNATAGMKDDRVIRLGE